MAWNPPATFISGAVLTAAQLNQIRESLLETATAKATTAGRVIVATGLNALTERAISDGTNNTSSGVTSTVYADLLASSGPAVTLTTGTTAMVHWAAQVTSTVAGAVGYCAPEILTSSVSASDNNALIFEVSAANDVGRVAMSWHVTGLTPGTNTFTLKYKSGGADLVTFSRRHLWVFPH